MNKKLKNILIVFVLLSNSLIAQDKSLHLKGELIVMISPEINVEKIISNNLEFHLNNKQCISKKSGIYLIAFDSLIDENFVLKKINSTAGVLLAQFNHFTSSRALPNDVQFPSQYGLHNTGQSGGTIDADIDAVEAWDITTGGLTSVGDSIVLAIVDNGFQLSHPDLNFWKNYNEIASNGIDDDGNGFIDDINGWNAISNNNIIGLAQHGTHVAGIAGARGNNAMGVAGVNWGVKLMPVVGETVLESVAIAAYSYVIECRRLYNETNGAKGAFVVVTNSSFGVDQGLPSNFPIWCAMYDSLGKQGILSAGATANNNWNIDVLSDIPTACNSQYLITVASTNRNDGRVTSSAYGLNTIDIAAPGSAILSTYPTNTYTTLSGTSMATPFVAGVVGLMYAAACDSFITLYKMYPDSFALMIKDIILGGVDLKPGFDTLYSSGGRLNAYTPLVNFQNSFNCNSVGMKSNQQNKNLIIAPNPATNKVSILNEDLSNYSSIEIKDMSGRLIFQIDLSKNKSSKFDLDISTITNGIYYLQILSNYKVISTKKLIKIGS